MEFAFSALAVLLAAVVVVGGWVVLANGLGFGMGLPTVWQGPNGPLVLAASTGVALAAALALLAQRSLAIARALAVVALCASVSIFDRWSAAPSGLGALAVSAAMLIVPALFTLATIARRQWRRLRISMWIVALVVAALILAFRDPFLDPLCAGVCGVSPFTISAQPQIVLFARWTVSALALAALSAGLVAAVPRGRPGLIGPLPSLSSVVLLSIVTFALFAEAAWASGLVETIPDLGLAWLVGLSLVGVSHILSALVTARRRAAVIALADQLTSATSARDDVGERLKTALRDPAVRIAYPLPDGSLVDAAGHVAAHAGIGEAATSVRRGDDIVAVLIHRAGIAGDDLATAFGPAAGLALANVRTRAMIRATLLELQALRLRLMDTGDEIRREIERNLHDGVQQTLLVLQYELALAAGETPSSGQGKELEEIRDEVQRLTERTRDLGHGLFPMSLDDVGLDAALQRLADESVVPFEPDVHLPQRPPRSVERTAYLVARDAVVSAAERARVRIRSESDSLVIDIVGGPLTAVSRDRVDALGGDIREEGPEMKVVLPCASS